jgi:hypothetical protein
MIPTSDSNATNENKLLNVRMKGRILRDILDNASTIADSLDFRFNENGLIQEFTDPAHVALMIISVDKQNFERFEIFPETRTVKVGINPAILTEDVISLDLDELRSLLRIGTEKEKLPAWVDLIRIEPTRDRFPILAKVNVPGEVMWGSHPCVLVRLRDQERNFIPNVPRFKTGVNFDFSPKKLAQVMKLHESISDYITLLCENDGIVKVIAEGDAKAVSFAFAKVDHEASGSWMTHLPVDYFMNFMRASTCFEKMTMRLGTDIPVEWSGTTDDGLMVRTMLAPRILNDKGE